MPGNLTIGDFENPISVAKDVHYFWKAHNDLRQTQLTEWDEIRKYIHATDTRFTVDRTSPWKNKTTRNKLAKVRDNLITQYVRNLLGSRDDFFRWYKDDTSKIPEELVTRINQYMRFKVRNKYVRFRHTMAECLGDFVDYGNTFAGLKYIRKYRTMPDGSQKLMFQGATPFRIPPTEMVFDPSSPAYEDTAIARRTLMPRADFWYLVAEDKQDMYDQEQLANVRDTEMLSSELQDWIRQGHFYQDGVSYLEQINSGKIELIEYIGNIYDRDSDSYLYNQHIIVADGMWPIYKNPNDTSTGIKPIVFSSWRKRGDNLWGQGPLDQVIGLQHRIDHIENLKADSVDLLSMPVIVHKGEGVEEEFQWNPGEQWNIGPNAEIEIRYPDPKIILYNQDIITYEQAMEEYAGVPRETAGFRTPGEKTAFEVQSLLSNANMPFEEKLAQFEDEFLEPLLNLMLDYNIRNITAEELNLIFPENILDVSKETLEQLQEASAEGRIYALGSKHYKLEQKKVEEITNLLKISMELQSPHFDDFKALKVLEREVGAEEEGLVSFGAALRNQAGLQQVQQQIQMEQQGGPGGNRP